MTASSALVGAATHALWDTFTHDGRWGTTRVEAFGRQLFVSWTHHLQRGPTLQYSESCRRGGHHGRACCGGSPTGGSWPSGTAGLRDLAPVGVTGEQRRWFWGLATLGLVLGIVWSAPATGGYATDIVRASLGLASGRLAVVAPAATPADVRLTA